MHFDCSAAFEEGQSDVRTFLLIYAVSIEESHCICAACWCILIVQFCLQLPAFSCAIITKFLSTSGLQQLLRHTTGMTLNEATALYVLNSCTTPVIC